MDLQFAEPLAQARRKWFASAGGPSPLAEELDAAREIREQARMDDAPRGEAIQVAWLIECYMGWPSFEGVVLTRDGDEPQCLHAWNILPGGQILDTAADLHGEPGSLILAPCDPGYRRYRREWTDSYNPSRSHKHPELAGVAWDGEIDMVKIMHSHALANSPAMR